MYFGEIKCRPFHNVEGNITSAHEKIAECKKEIQRAKRVRKNRQGMLAYILLLLLLHAVLFSTHSLQVPMASYIPGLFTFMQMFT